LTELAKTILTNYDLKPLDINLVQGGVIKTVWKIRTPRGYVCLKRLRQPPAKCSFTVSAQKYMADKGAKVPAVLPAKDGRIAIIYNNQVFVLYQWLDGRGLNFDKNDDLRKAVQAIAAFHRDSAGYNPPPGCTVSSKLGRWPHHYQTMTERFRRWKEIAASRPNEAASRVFREQANYYINLGEKVILLLDQSDYNRWVQEIEIRKNLCHQDYGPGNALLTPQGVYVLDLDGVTYDLPARDLRKTIIKRMETLGDWKVDLLANILKWYEKINPLTPAQRQVLYIDLLFPHEFHDTAKNLYLKNKSIKSSELNRVIRLTQRKLHVLEPLLS